MRGKIRTFRSLMACVLAAALATSCQDDLGRGTGEKKAQPAQAATAGETVTKVSTSTYVAEVRGASSLLLCSGPAVLEVMSNFEVRFPEFKLRCQGFEMDLAAMLNAATSAGGDGAGGLPDKAKLIEHDGYVMSIGEVAGAKFDPPRPFIIGPVIQDPAKYKGFSREYKSTVSGVSRTTKKAYNASGSFKVTVVNPTTNYVWSEKNIKLDNVIHWKNVKTGFDGVPSTFGMLFSEMEWYFSYRPILIPVIRIKGQMGDFIKSNDSGAANQDLMNALVGELTTTLKLQKYE